MIWRFVTQGQESEPETVAFEIIGLLCVVRRVKGGFGESFDLKAEAPYFIKWETQRTRFSQALLQL